MDIEDAVTIEVDPEEKDKPSNYISHNTSYRIKSKDEIQSFLTKLYKNHTLLSITVGKSNKVFGSVVLEVNMEKSYLVLDELYPRDEVRSSLLDQTISIETQIDRILLRFSSTIKAISEKDGAEYYKVKIPKYLYHHQRREYYRVPISISHPLPANLSTENNELLHAELRDLSIGGLSARLKSPPLEQLIIGDEIPTCIIQMPNKRKIVSAIEIVRIDKTKRLKNIQFGARFVGLNNADQRELSQAIAILDRERIKNLKRSQDD